MKNALPSALRSLIPAIESAIGKWPIKITIDHALKWVMQFDAADQNLAVRILENIQILGSMEIRDALRVAHTKLERLVAEKGSPIRNNNTLYAGIGNAAKSGGLISYHYRVVAGIRENDFLNNEEEENIDLSNINNIILIDDVVGTGKTIQKEITKIAEEIYPLSGNINLFVLTVAGYDEGVQHIVRETGASVVCALEYNSRDTASNLDAALYDGLPVSERQSAQEIIKRYCRSISRSELGFGGIGGLLVFDHNTPNTTLPIIWHTGNDWLPLFPRATRIPGTAKVLKSAQTARANASNQAASHFQETNNDGLLTLFVEGKIDEIFVDCMRQKHDLANLLGVKEVNAIALGGLHQSQRLLELLGESRKNAVFVLDNDEWIRKSASRTGVLEKLKVLYLKPNFISMLNLELIFAQRERFPKLPEKINSSDDTKFLHEVEMAVLKQGPVSANSERLIQIIDEFLDEDKYFTFTTELRKKIEERTDTGDNLVII